MGLIKNFIDFVITKKKVNVPLNSIEVEELYDMIKDICSFTDIEGVVVEWESNNEINSTVNFKVSALLEISSECDEKSLEKEINSAKSQLQSEDFILTWNKRIRYKSVLIEDDESHTRIDEIVIKHNSYIDPIYKK